MDKKDFFVCGIIFITSTLSTIFFLWFFILICSTDKLDFLLYSLFNRIFLITSIFSGLVLNFIFCLYSFGTIWSEKIK